MDFSTALIALKLGHKVTRSIWGDPKVFVVMQDGYPDGIPINANTARATGLPEGTMCKFQPYLVLHTAQDDFTPWAPTQSDVLTDDWVFEEIPR